MNEVIVKDKIEIENLIYKVRGKQVILDSDLAKLYGVPTKAINQAVARNLIKFPDEFSFKLSEKEKEVFWSQFVTKNQNYETRGGKYKNPRVFTEQGIIMLASVLKSETAIAVSINIVNAFVAMRKFLLNNADVFKRMISMENDLKFLNDKQISNDEKFEQIFNKLEYKELVDGGGKVFSDGQIYDAYSLLIDIISQAKNKIIIIDNYIDKTIFDILLYKKTDLNVEIYTNVIKDKLDVEKFNLQYPNVEIHKRKNLHDRYIIIDDKIIYHVGASLKDLGNKCFAISKLSDTLIPTIKKQVQ